jgi:hypothetical protein
MLIVLLVLVLGPSLLAVAAILAFDPAPTSLPLRRIASLRPIPGLRTHGR